MFILKLPQQAAVCYDKLSGVNEPWTLEIMCIRRLPNALIQEQSKTVHIIQYLSCAFYFIFSILQYLKKC